MLTFREIYRQHAEQYDRLVDSEDMSALCRALLAIRSLDDLDVVEFGAGTGRITRLLAPLVGSIRAFDGSPHMLSVAARRLRAEFGHLSNWSLAAADNRALPVAPASADVAVEGWSFGHATGWYPDDWPQRIGQMLAEMRRVLRPGGTMILIETLGTGRETPEPPAPVLADFYRWLVAEHGFSSTYVRTDCTFASPTEAESLTRFFFGSDLSQGRATIPECTGIWWRAV